MVLICWNYIQKYWSMILVWYVIVFLTFVKLVNCPQNYNRPPQERLPKLRGLCENILEPVRAHYGQPFRPNSAYRSQAVNKAVGSQPTSQHLLAEAVDIELAGVPNYDLARWIEVNLDYDKLILECYRPGVPNSGWVHVSRQATGGRNRGEVLTYAGGVFQTGLIA